MKDPDGSLQELERVAKAGTSVLVFNKKGEILMGKRKSELGPTYGDGKLLTMFNGLKRAFRRK